jgi:hypothetical protein
MTELNKSPAAQPRAAKPLIRGVGNYHGNYNPLHRHHISVMRVLGEGKVEAETRPGASVRAERVPEGRR